ncbi:uncharacterized protein [Hetaerina americana]|uniref:uncharacterized protein n=1 Tax=Hetaerina americana TaxID=62018 RepID=UPI003A7F56D7
MAASLYGGKRCMVKDCSFQEKKCFYFPLKPERAQKWREACGNPTLKSLPIEKLCSRVVVCKRHFASDQFVHPLVDKLNRSAVPTLFLPREDKDRLPDNEIMTPLDPSMLQHVIIPPIDIPGALDLALTDDPATHSNHLADEKDGVRKTIRNQFLKTSVPPHDKIRSENERNEKTAFKSESPKVIIHACSNIAIENAAEIMASKSSVTSMMNCNGRSEDDEVSMLESISAEITVSENSPASIENYLRCTEASDSPVLEAADVEMIVPKSRNASNYCQSTDDIETSILESTGIEMSTPESSIAPINVYYRYTLCRLCFSHHEYMIGMFADKKRYGFVITDAIEDLLQFKVSKTDHYPQFICATCLTSLAELKDFKDKCLKKKEEFNEKLRKQRHSIFVGSGDLDSWREKDSFRVEEGAEELQEVESMKYLGDSEEIAEAYESEREVEEKYSTDKEDEKNSIREDSEEMNSSDEDKSEADEEFNYEEDNAVDDVAERKTKTKMKENSSQGQHKCGECGETFDYINLWRKHMKEHQKTRPIPCQYCDKRYNTLVELNNHIIKHSDYKPYECEHCSLRCRQKSTLARHKLTHSDDKPFLCSICGIRFRSWLNLSVHSKMHLNVRFYKCEECDKEFLTSSRLTRHKMSHTGMPHGIYVCEKCGKTFQQKRSLDHHVLGVHSGEKQFPCVLCEKRFRLKGYLNNHIKTHLRYLNKK